MNELRERLMDDPDGSNATELIARMRQQLQQIGSKQESGVSVATERLEFWAQAYRGAIHVIELFASGRAR